MGLISNIRRWLSMVFLSRAKEEFDIKSITSADTDALVNRCMRIYQGIPDWLDASDDIKTVNFAEAICSEIARLTTLGIHIGVEGADQKGSRADYIQKQIDSVYFQLRSWVEYGCGYGTIILKPADKVIQVMTPDRFLVTEEKNGKITGAIFHDQVPSADGKTWYNRLEYHRFLENGKYAIDNRCYKGETKTDAGKRVNIDDTPWRGLLDSVEIENIEQPLFAVFRTPAANSREVNSPLGMPIFSNAIEELKDLDVAYSRNALEIEQSRRTVLMDADKLVAGKQSWSAKRNSMKLPKFVNNVEGNGASDFYQEINPLLNTDIRVAGINNLLSQIGFKCGFANGYFVFNEKSGFATATQVEADQQRTVQLVKDVRDKLEDCIKQLAYAVDKFADLYDFAPLGEWELKFDFGDILYSYEADKATWWNYVVQGKMPAWKYFEKFEGMTEDEAKELLSEATQSNMETQQLFASIGNE